MAVKKEKVPFKWAPSEEEFDLILRNDSFEQIQKLFHFMSYSAKKHLLLVSISKYCSFKIVNFFLSQITQDLHNSEELKSHDLYESIRSISNANSLHVQMIKLLIESNKMAPSVSLGELAFDVGNLELTKYLVEVKKIDLDTSPNTYGSTALNVVALRGNLEFVKYLIEERKTNVNLQDKKGNTALMIASEFGHSAVVKYLVDEQSTTTKTNLNVTNLQGNSALFLASYKPSPEIVKFLTEKKGLELNRPNSRFETPFSVAVRMGKFEIMKYLVEAGAKCNLPDSSGNTPFLTACYSGRLDMVSYLIERDPTIDFESKNGIGEKCLSICAIYGHLELLKFLIEKGTDLNQQNSRRETPLKIATKMKRTNVVNYLLEKGAKE